MYMVLASNFGRIHAAYIISDTHTFCMGVRNWQRLKLPANTIPREKFLCKMVPKFYLHVHGKILSFWKRQ